MDGVCQSLALAVIIFAGKCSESELIRLGTNWYKLRGQSYFQRNCRRFVGDL